MTVLSKQTLDIIGICIGSNHVPLYCQFSIYSESLLYHPMKKIDIECFTEPTEIYLFVWLEDYCCGLGRQLFSQFPGETFQPRASE